ncbi:MAG: 30S ribosomal protein S12 methylthiotransferase RimO [Desulfobacterales bacterium]|jgi:ribosomal protein S12 methylthiotransferase|nr:30S ribosomal protein S12 methylthiotransferase RimO [Desulfobacterales bacterium]
MKLHLTSLGCAKNQVDSELMLGRLRQAGWIITDDPEEAHAIVVNTCSFIEAAAQESLDTILELADYKKSGACRRLVVAGCLPERYREEIVNTMPEVDVFLGTGAFDQIVAALGKAGRTCKAILPDPDAARDPDHECPRVLSAPHMAYLKIAEGCSRSCSYCIIPKLRGRHRSRPMEDVVAEARDLVASGVNELILVAQDSTAYGADMAPRRSLGRLIESLAGISAGKGAALHAPWIRVLYGHPESIDDDFIRAVAAHPNACSYFDIPIQHASDRVLKRMGRRTPREKLRTLFRRIRGMVPDAVLRTTVIVGFPGETDRDFDELMRFVEDIRFDHLGAFVYSDAEDIPSHRLRGHVPEAIAQDRFDQLMSAQMEIAAEINQGRIEKTYGVLIEEHLGNHLYAGRTYFQAPEVDGVTYVNTARFGHELAIGRFVRARITDAMDYDLMGEVA